MPHTVPTDFAIDMYATYADSFDLSFLKSDSSSEIVSQCTSTTTAALSSMKQKRSTVTVAEVASQLSPCYIPTTVFNAEQQSSATAMDEDTSTSTSSSSNVPTFLLGSYNKNSNLYITPLPSPPQDSVMSPPPAYKCNDNMATWVREIKQEHLILPPSPPESDSAFESDADIVKNESDAEPCIDIEYFLKNSFDSMNQINNSSNKCNSNNNNNTNNNNKKSQDHQFLRECLQDTSFQKKHNLKPIALESLFGGWNLRGDIEPVISLALEQAKCDIRATCCELDISPGKL